MPKLKKELLRYIVKTMKVHNISQGEIGRRTGMNRINVNKTLKMANNPSLDQLVRIANSIGLNVKLEVDD